MSQLKAHTDSITTTHCFPGEPLMLTTSPDNSMKLWIFDMPDGGARLLRIREGHSAPPLSIKFHGSNGQNIISAGDDSTLRVFNITIDTLNRSMGTASYNRKLSKKQNRFKVDKHKMPSIVKFTSEVTRDKEWDSIAAIHNGVLQSTTWSYHKSKMGDLKLIPEKYQNRKNETSIEATCLSLTICGNFVVIGYSSGDLIRFNIQSGIERADYGNPNPAHANSSVRGVCTDNLNQFVCSGGGSDGLIKFWSFKSVKPEPIAIIQLDKGILLFESHRESGMLCVALDDFTIKLIDLDTKVIIREFKGHSALVTDVCFSPDSRWLITASLDCTVKVWDIPSAYLIDHFQVENACTSINMSPTGQFLATTHVNFLGIYLWANKSLFNHISLRAINPESEAPFVDLHQNMLVPSTITMDNIDVDMETIRLDESGEALECNYTTPEQLESILITMSSFSISKWQNLLNLDLIKQRNKPKAPLQKPKQAPFFIPTVTGPEIQFDLTNDKETDENSKILHFTNVENLSKFGKMLKQTSTNDNGDEDKYQSCIDYLLNLGPSMIDMDIKSLSVDNGGSVYVMQQFMKLLIRMFKTNLNFELTQSYLGVFLKSHAVEISKTKELRECLDEIERAQNEGWNNLEEKLFYGIGVVSALRNFVG